MDLSDFMEPPGGPDGTPEDHAEAGHLRKLCDGIGDAIAEYMRASGSMSGSQILRDWVVVSGRQVPFESEDSVCVLVAPDTPSYAAIGLLNQAVEMTSITSLRGYAIEDDDD